MSTAANVSNIPVYFSKSLENLENEIWKPVVGFEGFYEVSSYGRVKSLPRRVPCSQGRRLTYEKILSVRVFSGNVYPSVHLSDNKTKKTYKVHKLVAMAFLGFEPNDNNIVVDHIDSVKSNNTLENLQILTQRENCLKHTLKKQTASKFAGVRKTENGKRFYAVIRKSRENQINLGHFDTEEEASQRYLLELERMGETIQERFIKAI